MKNLILAAVAATMMPVLAHATSIQEIRTTQVMQCVDKKSGSELEACVSDVIQWTINNGAHEATREITSHIEDVTGIKTINGGYQVHAAIAQIDQALAKGESRLQQELDEANASLEHTSQNTQHMFDITAAIANHNPRDAKAFTQDPAGLIDRFYVFTIDRLADLKRSEDRIRQLEEQLEFYKSGGHWNPTNW